MPNEPDHQGGMHELLQAYARKRREDAGASAEMHPATRRLLLAEIRKQFGDQAETKAGEGSFWSRLLAAWPRWALGLTIFVALGFAAIVVFRHHEPSTLRLARNNTPAPGEVAKNEGALEPAPAAPAPTGPEAPVLLQQAQVPAQRLARADLPDQPGAPPQAPAKPAPPPALNAPADPKLTLADEAAWRSEMRKSAEAPLTLSEPTAVATAPAQPLAIRMESSPTSAAPKKELPVLTSFEFQQAGDQVRVIDADGSVYAGKVLKTMPGEGLGTAFIRTAAESQVQAQPEPVRRALAAEQNRSTRDQALGTASTNALTGYSFQVRGTNLRSQQSVQLDGMLTWSVPAGGNNQAGGQASATAQTQSAQTLRFYRAITANGGASAISGAARSGALGPSAITNFQTLQRIQGTLRVGGGNAQPIEAVPAGK